MSGGSGNDRPDDYGTLRYDPYTKKWTQIGVNSAGVPLKAGTQVATTSGGQPVAIPATTTPTTAPATTTPKATTTTTTPKTAVETAADINNANFDFYKRTTEYDRQKAKEDEAAWYAANNAYNQGVINKALNLIGGMSLGDNANNPTLLAQEINRIGSTFSADIPRGDYNFGSYYKPQDIVQAAMDNLTNTAKQNQTSKFHSAFDGSPTTYLNSMFAPTADDRYITDILNRGQLEANESIRRAQSRGAINELGAKSAFDMLNDMYAQGQSYLQDTGRSILDSYRGDAEGLFSGINEAISNKKFGTKNDLDALIANANSQIGEYSKGIEGAIRQAAASKNFFDLNKLFGAAGRGQGVGNDFTGSMFGAVESGMYDTNRNRGRNKDTRSLGTQGAF